MPNAGPRPATNADMMSAGGHCSLSSRFRQIPEKSDQRQHRASKGIGFIFIESVLPTSRKRLVTIGADAPLTEAAELLFEPTCRMIVVCDPAGSMVGVITRTDIIRQIRRCSGYACATRCSAIMTRQVISCRPDDRLHEVWAVMKDKQLHSVPIVDSTRRPIGVLSARDALETLLASVEYEEALLKDYIMGIGFL